MYFCMVAKFGCPCSKRVDRPIGFAHDLQDVAQRHFGRHGQAVADVARPVAESRHVAEDHQDLATGGLRPVEQVIANGVVGGMVELKPEFAFGQGADPLDAGGGDRTEDERDVVRQGCFG